MLPGYLNEDYEVTDLTETLWTTNLIILHPATLDFWHILLQRDTRSWDSVILLVLPSPLLTSSPSASECCVRVWGGVHVCVLSSSEERGEGGASWNNTAQPSVLFAVCWGFLWKLTALETLHPSPDKVMMLWSVSAHRVDITFFFWTSLVYEFRWHELDHAEVLIIKCL